MNYYIPTQVAAIPSYHLRAAYSSIHEKWSPYLNETTLTIRSIFEALFTHPVSLDEVATTAEQQGTNFFPFFFFC